MTQKNKQAFLFDDTNELADNLFNAIKDYLLQTNEVYEQHQQIYFTVFAGFIGVLILILATRETWINPALLAAFTFQLAFGSVYFRSATYYSSQRLELSSKLDLFCLQRTNGYQPDVVAGRPYLILDNLWEEFDKPKENKKANWMQDVINNFYLNNKEFLRESPREVIIAIINCFCLALMIWCGILCYPQLNYFNINQVFFCLIPSFIFYFIQVHWSQYLVNKVLIDCEKIYRTEITGFNAKKAIYLGGKAAQTK